MTLGCAASRSEASAGPPSAPMRRTGVSSRTMSEIVSSCSGRPVPSSGRRTRPRTPCTMKWCPSRWGPSAPRDLSRHERGHGEHDEPRAVRQLAPRPSPARIPGGDSPLCARRDRSSVVPPVRDAAAASASPHAPPPMTPTTGRDMRPFIARRLAGVPGLARGARLAVRRVAKLAREVQPGAHRVLHVVDAHVLHEEALAHAARRLRRIAKPVVVIGARTAGRASTRRPPWRDRGATPSGRPANRESATSAA